MVALLIAASIFAHQIEAITVKRYGDKKGKGGMFFNSFLCLFAVIYFIISDQGGFDFYKGIWIYAILNSLMFAIGFYTMYVAFRTGPFGVSRLLASFAGIVSIVFGVVFLDEKLSLIQCIAIVLIFISLILMRYQKQTEGEKKKFSVKWIIAMFLTILSNGAIGILGKIQQVKFDNIYKNEYLIITFVGSAIWLFILGLIYERNSLKPTIKTGFLYGLVAGVSNGIANWLTLVTYEYMNLSVASPLKTGLGMIVTFIISLLLYKERFSIRQYISVGIGVAAVVLISL